MAKILYLLLFFCLSFRVNFTYSSGYLEFSNNTCVKGSCGSDQYVDKQLEILNTCSNSRLDKVQFENQSIFDLIISQGDVRLVSQYLSNNKYYFQLFRHKIAILKVTSGLSPPLVS